MYDIGSLAACVCSYEAVADYMVGEGELIAGTGTRWETKEVRWWSGGRRRVGSLADSSGPVGVQAALPQSSHNGWPSASTLLPQ